MNLGAFFAASVWKRRKKPGYPLVSFAQHPVVGQKDTASIPCALMPRVNNPAITTNSIAPPSCHLSAFPLKSGLSKQKFVSVREAEPEVRCG
jgi:hypothetical protein